MNRSGPKGTYNAPALEKAFEIIELLATRPGGLPLTDISAGLGRSVGELFRIVIVMEKHGYLQKSELTDKYTVAYKMLDLAFRATPSQELSAAATGPMEALSEAIGQSCNLVVLNGGQGLVIARQEQPGTRSFILKLGAAIDLLRSCSGHVLLAFSPAERVDRLISLAEALPDARPYDRAALNANIEKVRQNGYDSRKSPITFGVTDISFPIFGFDGGIVAALTIPFLELIDGSQKVDIQAARHALQMSASKISDRLGHVSSA